MFVKYFLYLYYIRKNRVILNIQVLNLTNTNSYLIRIQLSMEINICLTLHGIRNQLSIHFVNYIVVCIAVIEIQITTVISHTTDEVTRLSNVSVR